MKIEITQAEKAGSCEGTCDDPVSTFEIGDQVVVIDGETMCGRCALAYLKDEKLRVQSRDKKHDLDFWIDEIKDTFEIT